LIPFFIYFAFSSFLGIGGVKIKEEKSLRGRSIEHPRQAPLLGWWSSVALENLRTEEAILVR
jgi:hypothetical protein